MNLPDILQSFLWTAITAACYLAGLGLRRLARNHVLANPALIAMILVAILLLATHTAYAVYFRATWVLTFLLAPATVALGIPLAKNFAHVRQSMSGVILGLVAGSLTSLVSGVLLVRWLGGNKELAMSMLPKAVTTPIAMSVAGQIGGVPALTAVFGSPRRCYRRAYFPDGIRLFADQPRSRHRTGGRHSGQRPRGVTGGGVG